MEAFSAVQADPKVSQDLIEAALTLLPELHAALDAAQSASRPATAARLAAARKTVDRSAGVYREADR
ncbi:hypothetical protein GCM10010507_20860 [Streptomyces cinnamoneus]|uniref:Uncharacterized protein n=1 Tax=Streptomyces cinnamoneus TaxID=53446 RepID=A0A918WGU7_STRCJ|nr:hypothetical protein GCM10010507_20860 [Streptomyces cinnamoneus]